MGKTRGMIRPEAKLLSSCEPVKPDRNVSTSKTSGATGIEHTFPFPKKRIIGRKGSQFSTKFESQQDKFQV